MAGYTRQDTTGQLANGNPIDADLFNDEYDAIEGAFNASTGHTHDGTTGGGAPIESIGPSQELEVTSSSVFPKVDNLIDSGKSTLRWRNGYFGTDIQVGQDATVTRDISAGRNLTVTGNATINGNTTIGNAASDTVTVTADVASNLIPSASGTYNLGTSTDEWNNLFLDGTANVDFLTVDEDATVTGDLAVTGATGIDGDFDINTTKVTIEAATGNTAIAGTLGVADVVSVTDLTGSTSTSTGALVVSGGAGIAENLYVGGNADITGTLDVAGDVTLADVDTTTLDVSGAVGIDGNFDIGTTQFTVDASNGNTAIAGTLDVTGDTTVENLTVNGNTTLGNAATDTITLTGVVNTSIIPSGTHNLGSSSSEWTDLFIDGTATIDTLTVDENATVAGTLGVTGAATLSDTLAVTGAATLSDTLAVTGASTLTGAATLSSTLAVTGAATLSDTLAVTGASTLTGAVTASGGITGNIDGIVGGTTPAAVTGTTIQFNTGLTDGTTTITGFVDEDDMTSDSATLIPTQQSVKAYVDTSLTGISAGGDSSTDFSAATLDAVTLDLNGGDGSGWTITQTGTDLVFTYNGSTVLKIASDGALTSEADVTGYGTV